MKSRTEYWLLGVCLLGGITMWPASGRAADGAEPVGVDTFGGLFSTAAMVDPAKLDDQRGGTDTVNNDIQMSGTVGNNQAWNLNTGTNAIADGAFVGANGFSTVVQNSGNNVLIQNSTIINIQLQ